MPADNIDVFAAAPASYLSNVTSYGAHLRLHFISQGTELHTLIDAACTVRVNGPPRFLDRAEISDDWVYERCLAVASLQLGVGSVVKSSEVRSDGLLVIRLDEGTANEIRVIPDRPLSPIADFEWLVSRRMADGTERTIVSFNSDGLFVPTDD